MWIFQPKLARFPSLIWNSLPRTVLESPSVKIVKSNAETSSKPATASDVTILSSIRNAYVVIIQNYSQCSAVSFVDYT